MNYRHQEALPNESGRRFCQQMACLLALLAGALVCFSGCPKPADDVAAPEGFVLTAPLRLLVVDDPAMAQSIERQWRARAEGEIEVRNISSDDLLNTADRPSADAIIYPSALLGELTQRDWISPIDNEMIKEPVFAYRDIFDLIRQREMVWSEKIYAVPFGSPVLMLVYRQDVFEQQGFEPPATWAEYIELAKRLEAAAEVDGQEAESRPKTALVEPLGPGWASQVLLARAAAYISHRSYFSTLFDFETMEPLIATEPFVRALDELVAAAKLAPAEAVEYAPGDALQAVRRGNCAMAMTWLTKPPADSEEDQTGEFPLAVAELPGSPEVYNYEDGGWNLRGDAKDGRVTLLATAGRLGSVTRSSKQRRATLQLLLLRLSGPDWSLDISPASAATTPFRTSQEDNVDRWVGAGVTPELAAQYADTLAASLRREQCLMSIRLPGRARYLKALDEAVHRAIRQEASSKECLERAAEQFAKITESIGVDRQKGAYWASLGIAR